MKTICAVLMLSTAAALGAQQLRLGVGQADITPPVGAPMAGYYTPRFSTGTHDPLHVKAIVLEKNGVKIAVISCDLVSLPREFSQQARKIIQEKTGLAFDHVMITSTHAHTTPVIFTVPSRYNLEGEGKRIAQEYAAGLSVKIAEAAIRANASLVQVQLRAGVGEENTTGFSRRFFMKDGSVGWNPGKLNPNIVKPSSPVDYGLPVLYFETPEAKPVAAYVNFGVHQDTTGGLQFSADYSYTLSTVLSEAKGDSFLTLFTIGAAGNVNHLDVSRPDKQNGLGEAARIGGVLAGAALKTIQQTPLSSVSEIGVSDRILKFEVPKFRKEELDWAVKTQATFGTSHAASFLDLVKAGRMLELAARKGEPLEAEVQVFTLGRDVAIASFPGEVFAEFGLQLKQDSPFRVTILAELANGALSYIPNRIAYTEGNYEPMSARLPVGGGEMLLQAVQEQMLELYKHAAAAK